MIPTVWRLVLLSLGTAGMSAALVLGSPFGATHPTAGLGLALLPLVVFHLVLAMVLLVGELRGAPRAPVPQTLRVRLPERADDLPERAAGWAAVCATWLTGNAMAFSASLGGVGWSEAWSCANTGPGEVSCNLLTGAWSNLFFVAAILGGLFFGGGLLASLVSLRRRLRARSGLGAPVVELSSGQVFCGVPFRLRVVQPAGRGPVHTLVRLRCKESVQRGTGDDRTSREETAYESNALHLDGRAGLTEGEATVCVPKGAMHSFQGAHHAVLWELVVVSSLPGAERTEIYPLPVNPGTPEAWRNA